MSISFIKKNKRVYQLYDYPVDSYKIFEFIPQRHLDVITSKLIAKLDDEFHFKYFNETLHILFAGIGYGRIEIPFLNSLKRDFPSLKLNAVGIDYSDAMIKELSKYSFPVNSGVELGIINEDINSINIKEKYDIIFSLFSFHLIGENNETTELFKSVMKNNSVIILSEEIGDFYYLENNIKKQKHYNSSTEYSNFWKYFHKEIISNETTYYLCDLDFIPENSKFKIIYEFNEYWQLDNLTYLDIKEFINGEKKVYDFFNYKFDNENILEKWLLINSFSINKKIDRKEGHKFYILKLK